MQIDLLTVTAGMVSFSVFLMVHLIVFRWVQPEHLLKSLSACVIATGTIPLLLMGIFCSLKIVSASVFVWVIAAILALIIQGLLSSFYILCIFGPCETSVRMRLVREIAAIPEGISLKDLAERYNATTIVKIRLQRLMGSGDIIEKDGVYRVAGSKNIFFVFDGIAGILKKWINQ